MNHDPATLEAFEQQVGILARRLRRAVGARARAVHPDLQSPGYLVLAWLGRFGPARSADLVEGLGIDKAAISRQVTHLLDLGLLERSRDPLDGRAAILAVTERAQRRLRDVARERSTELDARLAGWSTAEVEDLVRMLTRYNDTLGEGLGEAGHG